MARIDPRPAGLVKIIYNPGEVTQAEELGEGSISGGVVNLEINDDITAASLSAQLSQLGIEFCSLEELEQIAAQDGDDVFGAEEIGILDQYIEEALSDDKEYMLAAVEQNGLLLEFASERLQNDPDVVLAAVRQNGRALALLNLYSSVANMEEAMMSAMKNLEARNDKAGIISILQKPRGGMLIQFLSSLMRDDLDIALAAVKQRANAIVFLSPQLRDNEEIVIAALAFHEPEVGGLEFGPSGEVLEYASERFRDNPYIVLLAMSNADALDNPLKYASDRLQNNRVFVEYALRVMGGKIKVADVPLDIFEYGTTEDLWNNPDYVLSLLQKYPFAADCVSENLRNDPDFMLQEAKLHVKFLNFTGEQLAEDKNFWLEVVARFPDAPIPDCLREDDDFMLAAAVKNPKILSETWAEKYAQDRSFMLKAIKGNHDAFYFADASLRHDRTFILDALPLMVADKSIELCRRAIQEYGIDFPWRFSYVQDLQEVLTNLDNLRNGVADSRPLAVITYTKDDWNGAFEQNQIDELIQQGYNVLYFETFATDVATAAVRQANASKKDILWVIGMHGQSGAMTASLPIKSVPREVYDKFFFDLSDLAELQAISEYVPEGSVIVLDSCSTGQGREKGQNMVNLFEKAFPRAKVFGLTFPSGVKRYNYDPATHKVIGVESKDGPGAIYSSK